MNKRRISSIIDQTIKEVWIKNIPKDFAEGYIINEDCLKMSLCYHLRRKLAGMLKENGLRIYAENSLYDSIREEDVVALLELKFTSDAALSTENWMKDDVWKLKEYVQTSRLQCPLYFAVIYEVECSRLNWLDGRSTNHWAADRVTELDAGWIDGKMEFEINTY